MSLPPQKKSHRTKNKILKREQLLFQSCGGFHVFVCFRVFFFSPNLGFPGQKPRIFQRPGALELVDEVEPVFDQVGGFPWDEGVFFTYKFTHKENRPTLNFLFLMIFTLGLVGRIWVKEVNFWRFKILTWDAQTVPRMHHHAGLCVFLVGIFINLHFPPQLRMVSILNCNRLILQVRG